MWNLDPTEPETNQQILLLIVLLIMTLLLILLSVVLHVFVPADLAATVEPDSPKEHPSPQVRLATLSSCSWSALYQPDKAANKQVTKLAKRLKNSDLFGSSQDLRTLVDKLEFATEAGSALLVFPAHQAGEEEPEAFGNLSLHLNNTWRHLDNVVLLSDTTNAQETERWRREIASRGSVVSLPDRARQTIAGALGFSDPEKTLLFAINGSNTVWAGAIQADKAPYCSLRKLQSSLSEALASLNPGLQYLDASSARLISIQSGDVVQASALKALSKANDKQKLLLNFWGTWCPPCIEELPLLDDLQLKHASSLRIVGIVYEHGYSPEGALKTISNFLSEKDISYPQFLDNSQTLYKEIFSAHGQYPAFALFSPEGRLEAAWQNSILDPRDFAKLKGLLTSSELSNSGRAGQQEDVAIAHRAVDNCQIITGLDAERTKKAQDMFRFLWAHYDQTYYYSPDHFLKSTESLCEILQPFHGDLSSFTGGSLGRSPDSRTTRTSKLRRPVLVLDTTCGICEAKLNLLVREWPSDLSYLRPTISFATLEDSSAATARNIFFEALLDLEDERFFQIYDEFRHLANAGLTLEEYQDHLNPGIQDIYERNAASAQKVLLQRKQVAEELRLVPPFLIFRQRLLSEYTSSSGISYKPLRDRHSLLVAIGLICLTDGIEQCSDWIQSARQQMDK